MAKVVLEMSSLLRIYSIVVVCFGFFFILFFIYILFDLWIWTVPYSKNMHKTIHSLVAAKLILAKLMQIQNNTSGQCSYRLSRLIQMQGTSD